MNTIKIFLASSAELKDDRKEFEEFIGRENKLLQQKGTFLHLDIWEDFIDAVSATRLQDEYNKKIQAADIFVMLFFTKVGMYTSEEFDNALEQFKKAEKPLIYTYFKNADIKFGSLNRKEANSVWDFQEKLKALGHFQTAYENDSELKLHFKEQLDELFASNLLGISLDSQEVIPAWQIPKCLSAGQPSVPPGFVGREIELADVKKKLETYGLLMINSEGGMGKTTLAAKYLNDRQQYYKHYAWLFCDKGIIEQMKTLAASLHIDLGQNKSEDEQLLVIKTAMQNLPRTCLLILDNANEPKHIAAFQQLFDGLQWHILLTSRCQQVLPKENEYTLNHLNEEHARQFFKTYHDEKTPDFESLLGKFLAGIGYNTLMIELFSKNLHELSAIGETLANTLEQFSQKGLFLGERSFEIKTAYTGNIHREAATTDQILEVLYDLTKLEEAEKRILINLALLPAENHLLSLLTEVLIPDNKIGFAKQLKALAQKGWLGTDTKSYRISPVVQQIVLAKNTGSIEEIASNLVMNLNKKLVHDGVSLVNLGTYTQARPYADMAKFVTAFLHTDNFDTGLLFLYLSDYYKAIGSLKASLKNLSAATEIFKKIDQENYAVCIERLGHLYQQQGDFKTALRYFEQYNELGKTLSEANPQSQSLKNGLAISYEKLGTIYHQQGDLKKALKYFTQYNDSCKILFDAYPNSETQKNWLAISYLKLGDVYQQQGDLKTAIKYFELYHDLCKELVDTNPKSESHKSGLSISLERLGDIYLDQHDFKKALILFDEYKNLCNELYEANPQSEALKFGVAVSYERLGNIYQEQGDLKAALGLYQKETDLISEMFKENPHSEDIKYGLASSFERLGDTYQQQNDYDNALLFYERQKDVCRQMTEDNPYSVRVQEGLADSYANVGNAFIKLNKVNEARDNFEQAKKILLKLTKDVPEAVEYMKKLQRLKEKIKP
ncbi:MAG: tetratricopeptide repeat protein [Ferruginibacter sp.]